MVGWFLALLLATGQPHELANRALTPGDTYPAITAEQLCVPGSTKAERVATPKQQRIVWNLYGIPQADWHLYRLDDLVALGVGGRQTVLNLWPQLVGPSRQKDAEEVRLRKKVCRGLMTMAVAQRTLIEEWSK